METKILEGGAIQVLYKGVCIAEVAAYENEPGVDIIKVWTPKYGESCNCLEGMQLFTLQDIEAK